MNSLSRKIAKKIFTRTVDTSQNSYSAFTLSLEVLESRDVPSVAPDFWWRLNEAALNGAIVDSAAGAAAAPARASNFAAPAGAAADVPLLPYANATSRRFDGDDDRIVTNAAVNLSGDKLTIAAWVKVSAFKTTGNNISNIAGTDEWNGTTNTDLAVLRLGDAGLSGKKPQLPCRSVTPQSSSTGIPNYWVQPLE